MAQTNISDSMNDIVIEQFEKKRQSVQNGHRNQISLLSENYIQQIGIFNQQQRLSKEKIEEDLFKQIEEYQKMLKDMLTKRQSEQDISNAVHDQNQIPKQQLNTSISTIYSVGGQVIKYLQKIKIYEQQFRQLQNKDKRIYYILIVVIGIFLLCSHFFSRHYMEKLPYIQQDCQEMQSFYRRCYYFQFRNNPLFLKQRKLHHVPYEPSQIGDRLLFQYSKQKVTHHLEQVFKQNEQLRQAQYEDYAWMQINQQKRCLIFLNQVQELFKQSSSYRNIAKNKQRAEKQSWRAFEFFKSFVKQCYQKLHSNTDYQSLLHIFTNYSIEDSYYNKNQFFIDIDTISNLIEITPENFRDYKVYYHLLRSSWQIDISISVDNINTVKILSVIEKYYPNKFQNEKEKIGGIIKLKQLLSKQKINYTQIRSLIFKQKEYQPNFCSFCTFYNFNKQKIKALPYIQIFYKHFLHFQGWNIKIHPVEIGNEKQPGQGKFLCGTQNQEDLCLLYEYKLRKNNLTIQMIPGL